MSYRVVDELYDIALSGHPVTNIKDILQFTYGVSQNALWELIRGNIRKVTKLCYIVALYMSFKD